MKHFILTFIMLYSISSFARWAEFSEASYETIQDETKYRVYKDYNFEVTYKHKAKVLNEKGRDLLGTYRLNYQPAARSLKVTDAWSEKSGKIYNVPRSSIVDSPITTSEGGYDEKRQIIVPFSQVEVGTIVNYESFSKSGVPLLGQFSAEMVFANQFVSGGKYTFESDNRLYFVINDPDGSFEFKEEEKDSRFYYSVEIKKPIYKSPREEDAVYLAYEQIPSITVSSSDSFKSYYAETAKEWEEVLKSPLPESFNLLVEEAKTIADPFAKANFVSTRVATQMRYMGDWRSIKGGYVPRSLEMIANTQYGDCKDYSAILTKIYRELGFKSYPALVLRSREFEELPKIPTGYYFNHAITSIEVNGKLYWIDGTNFASNVRGVPDDIADRDAVLFDLENIRIEHLDWGPADNSIYSLERVTTKTSSNTVKENVKYIYQGEMGRKWTGQELMLSKTAIENQFKRSFTRESNIITATVKPFDLSSRIVSGFKIEMDIERYFTPAKTSAGQAIVIVGVEYDNMMAVNAKTRVSHFNNGNPGVYRNETTLKNFKTRGKSLKSCKALHPATDYILNVEYRKKGEVRVTETLINKKRFITPEELRAPEFEKFQKDFKACLGDRYLVYK